jgi:1,4-dihydroxy-6-naphthoate synthase
MPRIKVTIAHSPDADDAFMFYALAKGRIPTGKYEVTHVLNDIDTLNREAEKGTYEVTAVSFHQYPYVARDYALLTSGGSFGDGYGPVVVARGPVDLSRTTVAIPGERTTAALALRLHTPGVKTLVMPFDQVQPAVREGKVEAGVIIHEGQLSFEREGLQAAVDLGAWWREETGGMPLPLGGNAVRKDLGWAAMGELGALVRDSIDFGLAHREEALDYALGFGRGLDRAQGDRFVGMYVNARTREAGAVEQKAVQALLERAYEARLIPLRVPLEFVQTAAFANRRWP